MAQMVDNPPGTAQIWGWGIHSSPGCLWTARTSAWRSALPSAWALLLPACTIRTSADCSAMQGKDGLADRLKHRDPAIPLHHACLGAPNRGLYERPSHVSSCRACPCMHRRGDVLLRGAHQGCTAMSLGLPKVQRGTTCTGRRQERMVLAAPRSASSAAMSIPAHMPACFRACRSRKHMLCAGQEHRVLLAHCNNLFSCTQ